MFCEKCGSQLPEGAAFCEQCGASVNPTTVQPVEQPIEQPVMQEVQQFAQPEYSAPVKKKKAPIVLGIIAAVVVALGAVVACNFSELTGFVIKTFGSDEAYLKYVEKKAFDTYTDDFTEFYGTYIDQLGKDASGEVQIGLNVSQEALDLVAQTSGSEMDLDWLNDILLDMDVTSTEDMQSMDAKLCISDTEILDTQYIYDLKEQKMFLAFLNLSETYFGISMMDEFGYEDYNTMLYNDRGFIKALPSDEEVNELVKVYLGIVIEHLNKVEKSSDTLKVDGVKQKVTTLELTVDTDTIRAISIDVLQTMKKDKDLEKYINDLADYMDESEDAYDSFEEGIDDLLDELEDADDDNEELMVLTDYVDSKHVIVGRGLEVEGEEILSYAKAQDGDKFAIEAALNYDGEEMSLEGSGTDKRGKVDAEYEFVVADMDMFTVSAEDFFYEEDEMSGSIQLLPSQELLSEMGLDESLGGVISVLDTGLEFVFDVDTKTAKTSINIINKGETFAGIDITSSTTKPDKIEVPSESDVTEDEDAWIESMDLSKIAEALREAGLPEELVYMAEMYLG